MISSLFIVTAEPAPLAGMAFPAAKTDWHALGRRGFSFVIRLHAADYDPAPLRAKDVTLEDLYGGAVPCDPVAEQRRIWDAGRFASQHLVHGEGVVVHCLGGTGRTGTVLGCALRELGRSGDEAIDTVQQHRPHWPESPWQEEVVRGSA
jgi:hypothetical protein